MCIILVLDATFVPNLTFLGLLSPEILFGEKTVSHPADECLGFQTEKRVNGLTSVQKKEHSNASKRQSIPFYNVIRIA